MSIEYRDLVVECAEQGKALSRWMANNGIFEPMYLYARPSSGSKAGKLILVRDSKPAPLNAALVTGEGLRANVPYENYFSWIYDRATRAPILATEEQP